MRARSVVLVAVLALLTPMSAGAQATDTSVSATPIVITTPRWERGPRAEFPERALHQGISAGRAIAECGILPNGELTDCRIVEEDPAGAGFGGATLRAASRAQLAIARMPEYVPNARVRFVTTFALHR